MDPSTPASRDAGTPLDPVDFDSPGSAALAYATRFGWAVLPCHTVRADGSCSCEKPDCERPGKHPRTPHGVHDASRDPAVVVEWWRKWPDANVAIATGAISSLVVLDFDPRNGGDDSLIALREVLGPALETPVVLTGGGGQHFYFLYEGGPLPAHLPEFPGLDILGDGHFVIAPPSVHASGKRYEWEASSRPDDVPLERLPELPGSSPPERASAVATEADRIPVGQRNKTLARLGGAMRRVGASPPAIEAALLADNQHRCEIPLGETEVLKTAHSVSRYPAHEVSNSGAGELAPVEYLDLDAYRAGGIPAIRWLLPDWLASKDIALIAGPGGAGKSTTVVDLAVALATGRLWCGIAPTQRLKVLLFDEEQDEPTAARLIIRLLGDLPADNLRIAVGQAIRLDSDEGAARLEREIATHRPGLVVIDSVQQAFGRTDENSATEVGGVYAVLFRLRDKYAVTFVLVHHRRKSSKDLRLEALELVRGSSAHGTQSSTVWLASPAGPDLLDLVQAKRRGAPKRRMQTSYHEDGPDAPIVLTGRDLAESDTPAQRGAEEWIVEFLADRGQERRKEILGVGELQGHKRATIERGLTSLLKRDVIDKVSRGVYRVAKDSE